MNKRIERVGVTLQRELGRMIDEELSDPRLAPMTSITHVDCTADLGTAHVYVSVYGDETARQSSLEALQSAAGFLRRGIDSRIKIRHVPRLAFHIDPALAEGADMLRMMDEVARQDSMLPKADDPEDAAPGTSPGGKGQGDAR